MLRHTNCPSLSTFTLLNTLLLASAFSPPKLHFLHRNPSFHLNHEHNNAVLLSRSIAPPRLRSASSPQRSANLRLGWNNRPARSVLSVSAPFGDFSRSFFNQAMSDESSKNQQQDDSPLLNIAPFFSGVKDAAANARRGPDAAVNAPALIVCGPSGVGKGTLLKLLQQELGQKVGFCVSHATRAPREGEEDGVHYSFVSEEEMRAGIAKGEYIEFQEVHGALYGTSFAALDAVAATGAVPLLDVDVRGAQALRAAGVQGQYVFIAPPDEASLEARLRSRGTETEEAVTRRLNNAKMEMEISKTAGLFDHVIVNDQLSSALASLASALPKPIQPSSGSASADASAASKPEVVFILGGPGSGKGTQSELLQSKFVASHLSAGELLRKALKNPDSSEAPLIDECIKQGRIVPVEITCRLLQQEMEAQLDSAQDGQQAPLFLIDGFPRNLDNFQGWEQVVGDNVEILFVLFFDCDQDVMLERLLERAKSSGRSDDNMESINKRFRTFESETMPVVKMLEEKGIVRHVDAQKDVQGVFAQVEKIFRDEGLGRYQL